MHHLCKLLAERPGQPLDVQAQLQNDTVPARVLVTWRDGFDGNSPIIKYVIEARALSAANGNHL